MKNRNIIIAILVIIIIAGIWWQQRGEIVTGIDTKNTVATSTSTLITSLPLRSVAELAEGALPAAEYNVSGYVRSIYACPPCPPNANCKPCMKNNIVITDNAEEPVTPENSLIIFTDQSVEVGVPYEFSVRVSRENTTGRKINDLELIGFRPVGE